MRGADFIYHLLAVAMLENFRKNQTILDFKKLGSAVTETRKFKLY